MEECSDDNENILNTAIQNNFNAIDLDMLASNYDSKKPKIKKIQSLIQQFNFFSQMSYQKEHELINILQSITKQTGTINYVSDFAKNKYFTTNSKNLDYVHLSSDTDVLNEIEMNDSINFEKSTLFEKDIPVENFLNQFSNSNYYNTLLKTVLHEVSNIESSTQYISKQCPIQCLCKLHKRDTVIHKSLMIYDSFIDILFIKIPFPLPFVLGTVFAQFVLGQKRS